MYSDPKVLPVEAGSQDEGLSKAAVPQFRILVVDDHESFRRYVSQTLQRQAKLHVVAEVQDGLEAVRQAEILRPDLVLLDIGLPRLNGLEAARRIGEVAPTAKIIFLTQESSSDVVQEAFRLGAWGYVVKVQAGNELLAAVEAVMQGRTFVSTGLDGYTQPGMA